MRPLIRAVLRGLVIFGASTALVWYELAPFFDPRGDEGARLLSEERATLADTAREAEVRATLRRTNPEWDLMRRTFVGLTLANEAERDEAHRADVLWELDALAEDLLEEDAREGVTGFLLPYGKNRPFQHGEHSIFVDGEIAVALAAREVVAPASPAHRAALDERITRIETAMDASPSRSGESYPDEAWSFCNTTALAALRLYDVARGTDHRAYATAWIEVAKAHLIDERTGVLVSSYRWNGAWLDRSEGSTIFMAAHNLLLWDDAFARDQWAKAKQAFVFDVAGFTLAREWPHAEGATDIDSGPVIPLLDASPGASGLAVLGAAAFADGDTERGLLRSLRFAAFPQTTAHGMRFAGASPMGDAVIGYALSVGPIWDKANRARTREARR
ncbi:hypothetical protein BH09MYX1_BH09MYX1_24320 [soil metagenome]